MAPTECVCKAEATYIPETGGVQIDFNMCDEPALDSDFIGIYPCDADTMVADKEWWDTTVCNQFSVTCGQPIGFGFNENQTYVGENYIWFSWTCSSPEDDGCQTVDDYVWPTQGTVTLDPSSSSPSWPFPGGRELAPGCYKAVLQRDIPFISTPPHPTICGPWEDELTFTVPDPNTSPPLGGMPAQCSAHSECSHLGGDCCPTTAGVQLDCCDDDSDGTTPPLGGAQLCSAHPECVEAQLGGDCCPAPGGIFLECCAEIQQPIVDEPSCSKNPVCGDLTGDCCPTDQGVILDCCASNQRELATAVAREIYIANQSGALAFSLLVGAFLVVASTLLFIVGH